jgi:hypothetical protein
VITWVDISNEGLCFVSMFVFWVVKQCGLVCRYRRFGETYCLHLQGWRWTKAIASLKGGAVPNQCGWSPLPWDTCHISNSHIGYKMQAPQRLEASQTTLKMETVCFSETLVPTYKSTRRYNLEQHLYLHRGKNLKRLCFSCIVFVHLQFVFKKKISFYIFIFPTGREL